MRYADFRMRSRFERDELLLAFARGALVEDPPEGFQARLPLPPLLMVDRIDEISRHGRGGRIVAEQRVSSAAAHFAVHFVDDPVLPGCLILDGVWQLVGFFCAWQGGCGSGRALGVGQVEFEGEIRPEDRSLRYEAAIRRCTRMPGTKGMIAIADAEVRVDGRRVCRFQAVRSGALPRIGAARPSAAGPARVMR